MSDETILDLDEIEPDASPAFRFRFGGEEFACRNPNDLDVRRLDALLAAAQQNPAVQLEWMLGDEQWERLDAIEKVFTMGHLNRVTEDWLDHHGLSVPKSAGLPKPSKATAMR